MSVAAVHAAPVNSKPEEGASTASASPKVEAGAKAAKAGSSPARPTVETGAGATKSSAASASPKLEAGANAAKAGSSPARPTLEAGASAAKSSTASASPKVEAGASSATKPGSVPTSPKSGAGPSSAPTGVASPDSAPRFAWPSMRVLEQVDASEVVEAGGVPVVLRAVVVKERAEDLIQRFADAFRAGGLHVPPGAEQPQLASGAAMLTAIDMYRGITFTVILQPQDVGVTLVYLGEANHTLRREPGTEGDVASLPPGARQVLRVNDEGSRTLSFLVPMSAGEVDAFYAQALRRDGWRREDGDMTVYTRSGEELRIVHEPAEGGLRSVVLVHRGRSPAR
nr:hypothetical protein [Myxococcus sp. CA056]